jgi:hypothetical protein
MQYHETLRGIDPEWEKKIRELRQLVTIAGSPGRFAEILGLPVKTIYSFGRSGQVSPVGALLVETSKELGELFKARELRPDIKSDSWERLKNSKRFKDARKRQKKFEKENKKDHRSPIQAIDERLGVVDESE